MANEINMAQKHSIATLHARGVSNREIARLLGIDRGTVNRQVSLLKSQNRPEAPTGKTAGIELSC
ncbi:MAG: helix-turn-helix domain-containing protein, partial [Planctomycetota bacterium]|nr:helix-turn-helix domain-containing protein [Planctomycetota bacterium]